MNRHQWPAKMAAASYARHVGVAFALSWFWGEASDVFTVPYSTQSCHRCRWPRLRLRVVFISAVRSLLHCPWRAREPAFLQLVCGPASRAEEFERLRFSSSANASEPWPERRRSPAIFNEGGAHAALWSRTPSAARRRVRGHLEIKPPKMILAAQTEEISQANFQKSSRFKVAEFDF